MGADNLATFHHWDHWDWIMENVPVGVMARPGEQVRAGLAPAARRFARHRLAEAEAGRLALAEPPAWAFLTGAMVDISSTALRDAGAWER